MLQCYLVITTAQAIMLNYAGMLVYKHTHMTSMVMGQRSADEMGQKVPRCQFSQANIQREADLQEKN